MGQRLYTTTPMAPSGNSTAGPIEHGLTVSFDTTGTIDGIYVYSFSSGTGGTPNGEAITVKVKDSTGTTTLATGTALGTGTAGEIYIPLSSPLSVIASTNYQIIDAMSASAYRFGQNVGGLSASKSNGHITAASNSGLPTAANETYVDLSFTASQTVATSVAYRASSNNVNNSTSASISVPGTCQVGDVFLIQLSLNNTDVITAEPANLTLLNNNTTTSAAFPSRLYVGVVDGSNIAAGQSLTWSLSATRAWAVSLYAASGVDTTNPILGIQTAAALSSTVTMPTITTGVSSWLVEIGSAKSNGTSITTWTPPSGWTIQTTAAAVSNFAGSSFMADRTLGGAPAGSYGGETYTPNASPSVYDAYAVALRPLVSNSATVAWLRA